MINLTKTKKHAYTLLNAEEYGILDENLKNAGIPSRTVFFTLCSQMFLYGGNVSEFCSHLNASLKAHDKVQNTLYEILDTQFFPAIAMKGLPRLIRNGIFDELRDEILDRCGKYLSEEEFSSLLQNYAALRQARIEEYRANMRRNQLRELTEEKEMLKEPRGKARTCGEAEND